jgi:hypothetical protein
MIPERGGFIPGSVAMMFRSIMETLHVGPIGVTAQAPMNYQG